MDLGVALLGFFWWNDFFVGYLVGQRRFAFLVWNIVCSFANLLVDLYIFYNRCHDNHHQSAKQDLGGQEKDLAEKHF